MYAVKKEPKDGEVGLVLTFLEAKNLLLDLESESKEHRTTTKELIKQLKKMRI